MASLFRETNGNYRIQFCGHDGKRKSIGLGAVTEDQAERQRAHVEDILRSRRNGHSPQASTIRWLAEIGDALARKLANVGLVESRSLPEEPRNSGLTLVKFLDDVIAGRSDAKLNTLNNLKTARNRLVDCFGHNTRLADVTPGDADDFALWMRRAKRRDGTKRYAAATIGRTVRRAKQFFRIATRRKILAENPFADVKSAGMANEKRKVYVSPEIIAKVIDACPDAEWRLIIALSRYGGLRCPSEHLALKLEDIDLAGGRMTLASSKLEHCSGGGIRVVPIFPELRPYLEAVYESAETGSVYAIQRYRSANTNLRTQFLRIIKRAGMEPWPKLFHNLRASAQTDLSNKYPVHWVCRWLGNSALIADKHYLTVPDNAYDLAAGVVQKAAQQGAASAVTRSRGASRVFRRIRRSAKYYRNAECPL